MKPYRTIVAIAFGMSCANAFAGDNAIEMLRVGEWTNVVSFSINEKADHIVMTREEADGTERAYETRKNGGTWSAPKSIETVNGKCTSTENVGGIFMTKDERRIYFHANYEGGAGGYDIYYCDLTADGWGEPQIEAGISTSGNETYPSITDGKEKFFFLRHQPMSDMKKEKKEADKQTIYYAIKNAKGEWERAQPTNNALNVTYAQDAVVASDGLTLYYSARPEKKEGARVYFTVNTIDNEWYLPETAFNPDDSFDYTSPCYADGKIYCIHSNTKKRNRTGYIVAVECPKKMHPLNTVDEAGEVRTMTGKKPISADITVYNPTTMAVEGRYKSTDYDGTYGMTNLAQDNYIVDVRSKGYSYASYQLNYKDNAKSQMPNEIELFDTIAIDISVYDSEIFRPLKSKVIAVRSNDKAIFRSTETSSGHYLFNLPLGSNYNIIATSKYFDENKFLFRIEGDIVFKKFERELPLNPQKFEYVISVVDAETKAPLNANIELANTKREETIYVKENEMTNGKDKVMLRAGDAYDMIVSGVQNYSFHKRSISVTDDGSREINIELIPLRANSAVRLNNINFETASAELLEESFSELEMVIRLMNENPSLRFEIAAHTDNVGNAKYNMKLSEKRAESVVNYLTENGISEDRLEPKGYGMTKPLVDNSSDENKALNRRVEFMIIESH